MSLPEQKHVIDSTAGISEAEQIAAGLIDSVSRVERLQRYSVQLQLLEESIAAAEQDIIRLAGLDLAAITYHSHAENIRQLDDLLSLQFQLRDIGQRLKTNKAAINRWVYEEKRCCEEYKSALLTAGVCPVCGSRVSEQNLKEVV